MFKCSMVWLIAWHELNAAWRTKRALMMGGLYLLGAWVGASIYTGIIHLLAQKGFRATFESRGPGQDPEQSLTLLGQDAYERVISFLAGAPVEKLSPLLLSSPTLGVLLWGSLTFLPMLILLTTFDSITSDLERRTLTFSTLRASRTEILLGKVSGQFFLFAFLSALSAGIVLLVSIKELGLNVGMETVGVAFIIWIYLLPIGLSFIALTAFSGTLSRKGFSALMLSLLLLAGFRALSMLEAIPQTSSWSFLRFFSYLSPRYYLGGLWQTPLTTPLLTLCIYLVFSFIVLTFASKALAGRDL